VPDYDWITTEMAAVSDTGHATPTRRTSPLRNSNSMCCVRAPVKEWPWPVRRHGTGGYTITSLVELFNISRTTVYRTLAAAETVAAQRGPDNDLVLIGTC